MEEVKGPGPQMVRHIRQHLWPSVVFQSDIRQANQAVIALVVETWDSLQVSARIDTPKTQ